MDNDVLSRLEKQMEGNGLALAAVAEVLQKMDQRLTKAEDDDDEEEAENEEKAMLEAAEMEKSMLVKAIADEVFAVLKESAGQSDNGMDVDGENTRTATKGGSSTSADDSEQAVTIDTKTENVQGIIQAMQKQLYDLSKEYGMDEEEDEDEPVVATEDDEDEDDNGGIFNMKKQMESMVKAETEKRLEKMGFKEETSLQRPAIVNYDAMGVDGTQPIKKSEGDPVEQLTNLSYKQLREMQFAVEQGDTNGIPQELL